MLRTALGVFRLAVAFPVIGVGSLLIVATMWIPVRIKGIRLAAWLVTLIARLAMLVFNVRFRCDEPDKFFKHHGFVFPNHITFFDILMMVRLLPMRFVSALENRSWPFIGWVAIAIGTVFVNRSDKASRAEARAQLAKAERYPPIVLYPEGAIGPAHSLRPFRYGAFEIAVENGVPYLPCVIVYDYPEAVEWTHGQTFMQVFWRLACYPGPLHARLVPLEVVQPKLGDDPKRLAAEAHRAIAAVLGVTPHM